jgi:hypothetical protein
MPTRFFKKHRVRASFYHIGALLFLCAAFFYYVVFDNPVGWFDVVCVIYFVVDYVAEFFDPNPSAPGTGYAVIDYFHRAFDGDSNEDE